jgi:hypothetical protein
LLKPQSFANAAKRQSLWDGGVDTAESELY